MYVTNKDWPVMKTRLETSVSDLLLVKICSKLVDNVIVEEYIAITDHDEDEIEENVVRNQ